MSDFITNLEVSTNPDEEQTNQDNGFTKINVNLNMGTGGQEVYLWYKKGAEVTPITRVQVTFNQDMENGLKVAKYTKIPKDLNAGTERAPLFMWFSRASGEHDVPIVDIAVTTEAQHEANMMGKDGVWERVICNLNLGVGGNWVYAWLKREKPIYISEVTATDNYNKDVKLFSDGYTRVDVNTNSGAGGSEVFIWYRKTTVASTSISLLQISTTPEQEDDLQQQGYQKVNVNLNEKTSGNAVYLWWKKGGSNHIKAMTLLQNMAAVGIYDQAGIKVIERNLNEGNSGSTIYLCYK